MNHFQQIAGALAENGLDAVMLTAAPNRLYASGFRSSAGLVLVTREKAWFFTDSRYIEAASRGIQGADVEMVTGSISGFSFIIIGLCSRSTFPAGCASRI